MADQPRPQTRPRETFSSGWGLILAALGMAIGTGNIWRFPRVLADNGGAVFLIPWAIFLFSWSIPLLMVEFGLGRRTGRGPIGAFATVFGARTAFLGFFVAMCSSLIMFYYAVVTGWCLRYLGRVQVAWEFARGKSAVTVLWLADASVWSKPFRAHGRGASSIYQPRLNTELCVG